MPTPQLSLAVGQFHACAIKVGGTVQCWGSNLDVKLGNASQTSSHAPVDGQDVSDVKSISAGSLHTCALTEAGNAVFIEQYNAHITACNNTTSTAITEAEQQACIKLWACGDATRKTEYLSGTAQSSYQDGDNNMNDRQNPG